MTTKLFSALAATLMLVCGQAMADDVGQMKLMCPDAKLWGSNIINGICWSCLFPMKLMGVAQIGKGSVPPAATRKSTCKCDGNGGVPDYGYTIGMWSPSRLVELVRQPYCSPSLGGMVMRKTMRSFGTKDGTSGTTSDDSFYNYHYFAYPLYSILDLLVAPECDSDGYFDMDLMYMSELDPTWNEDELAMLTNPEVAVAANPLMQASCVAECATATFNRPVDTMWWCAGCWGGLYPFSGNEPAGDNPPRVTSLLATRAVAALHRRGLARKTVGDDALCGGQIYPMIPKSQYKMSMLFPIPEANNAVTIPTSSTSAGTGNADIDSYQWDQKCCHYIGVPTMLWGEWRNVPATGEDFVYMLWRWIDCCVR
jgi:conjugal transfer pilus assembly protein TraU